MKSLVVVLALAVVVALAVGSAIVVDATEYAVVTRFGRPARTYTTPGLHFRMPLVDQVVRLDARLLMTEPPVAEYLTLDKKNVVARTFSPGASTIRCATCRRFSCATPRRRGWQR